MMAEADKAQRPNDWAALRERLARALPDTDDVVSPERAKRIMDERAQALARVPGPPRSSGERIEVLTFDLAGERYAIETRYVQEVLRLTDLTPVPGTPDFIFGVVILRGEILAVVDVRRVTGILSQALTNLSYLIVLGTEIAEFAILADAMGEVSGLWSDDLFNPPGPRAGLGQDWLRGVTGDALVVVDGRVLLTDSRLFVDHQ